MARSAFLAVLLVGITVVSVFAQSTFDGISDECELELRQTRVVDKYHLQLHVSCLLTDRNSFTNRYAPVAVYGFLVDVEFPERGEPTLKARGPIWQDHSGIARQERRFPLWGTLSESECYFLTPCGDLVHLFSQGPATGRRLVYREYDFASRSWPREFQTTDFQGIEPGATSPSKRYRIGRKFETQSGSRVIDVCALRNVDDTWINGLADQSLALNDPDGLSVFVTNEINWCLQNSRVEPSEEQNRYRREWSLFRRSDDTPTKKITIDGKDEQVLALVERTPKAVSIVTQRHAAGQFGHRIYNVQSDGAMTVTDFMGENDLRLTRYPLEKGGVDEQSTVIVAIEDESTHAERVENAFQPELKITIHRCDLASCRTDTDDVLLSSLFKVTDKEVVVTKDVKRKP